MSGKKTVKLTIDGRGVEAIEEESLLKVAEREGFDIPHLCYHEAVAPYGACRLCLVEVQKGRKSRLTTACNYPALEGISVTTRSEKIDRNRRMMIELLVASCPEAPELHELAEEYGVGEVRFAKDANDCINCGLCERVCREVVGANAITFVGRGDKKKVAPAYGDSAELCIACGACVYVCPVRCIHLIEQDGYRTIDRWNRRLPLAECKTIGLPFAPRYQLEWFSKRVGGLAPEVLATSPGARK